MNVDLKLKKLLRNALSMKDADVVISFTKADGTEREMACTTCFDLVPSEKLPKEVAPSVTTDEELANLATQRVFDVDKQEWRSFNWSNLKSVQITL